MRAHYERSHGHDSQTPALTSYALCSGSLLQLRRAPPQSLRSVPFNWERLVSLPPSLQFQELSLLFGVGRNSDNSLHCNGFLGGDGVGSPCIFAKSPCKSRICRDAGELTGWRKAGPIWVCGAGSSKISFPSPSTYVLTPPLIHRLARCLSPRNI